MIEIINMSDQVSEGTELLFKREKPNKIKQIGQPENRKLYMEDYVYTYLYQIAAVNLDKETIAIFLGTIENEDAETCVYVEGAVEVNYHLVDQYGITFTEETWSDLHEKINQYFFGRKIVGWFISQPGFGAELNEVIVKINSEYFSETGQALFVVDRREKEECYYYCENGVFKRQEGYYIFYERNQAMQDFMIESRQSIKPEMDEYEPVIENYRKVVSNKKEENYQQKIVGLLYATSTALAVVILVIGIVMLNNYDKMKQMEDTMQTINNNFGKQDVDTSQVLNENNNDKGTDASKEEPLESANTEKPVITKKTEIPASTNSAQEPEDTDEKQSDEKETQDETKETQDEIKEAKNGTDRKDEPVISVKEIEPIYKKYTVRKGDTLANIMYQNYKSIEKIDDVLRINNIKNKDKIYEGDILLLPE